MYLQKKGGTKIFLVGSCQRSKNPGYGKFGKLFANNKIEILKKILLVSSFMRSNSPPGSVAGMVPVLTYSAWPNCPQTNQAGAGRKSPVQRKFSFRVS